MNRLEFIITFSQSHFRDSLAFATEPCFCSLANVLGNHENMPTPLPDEFSSYKLFEVEIKYGLMQVAEGLSFLHKDVKMLHRNICPESIIINSNGAWKIAGFELFATNINDPNDAVTPNSLFFLFWDMHLRVFSNSEAQISVQRMGWLNRVNFKPTTWISGPGIWLIVEMWLEQWHFLVRHAFLCRV